MDELLYYSLTIAICLAAILFLSSLRSASATFTKNPPPPPPALPPGPPWLLSLVTPLLFLGRSNFGIERVIRAARSRYGPVFTLRLLPSRQAIFIADHAIAHRALVQRGAAFADRPPPTLPSRVFSSGQRTVTSGAYGPLWRALRRNLTFHPPRLRRYAGARRRAVAGLLDAVNAQMDRDGVVVVEGLLHRALFQVLVACASARGLHI